MLLLTDRRPPIYPLTLSFFTHLLTEVPLSTTRTWSDPRLSRWPKKRSFDGTGRRKSCDLRTFGTQCSKTHVRNQSAENSSRISFMTHSLWPVWRGGDALAHEKPPRAEARDGNGTTLSRKSGFHFHSNRRSAAINRRAHKKSRQARQCLTATSRPEPRSSVHVGVSVDEHGHCDRATALAMLLPWAKEIMDGLFQLHEPQPVMVYTR